MGLAVLAHQQAGERVLIGLDAVGDAHQDGAALVRGQRGHTLLAGLRGFDRPLDIGRTGARHRVNQGAGRRISHFVGRPVCGRCPCAINQHVHDPVLLGPTMVCFGLN